MANSKRSNVLRDALSGVRGIFIFSVVMSLVYGLLKLAGPLFMILVFDRVLPSRSYETLVALLLLLAFTIGMMTLLDYSRRRIMARFGAQFQERIEHHIFSCQSRESYYGKGGSKPATGLSEADQLRGFFHSGSLITILDFLWSPVFLAIVFVIDPLIGWVVVAGLAVLVTINIIKVSTEKARQERSRAASERVGELKDALLVSRHVIEQQQLTAAYNDRWVDARRDSRDAAVELKDWSAWFSIMASHTALLIQYVALAAGAYQTIAGEITVGAMVASMYLARHVVNRAERFMAEVPEIQEAGRNWRKLDRMLSVPRLPTASPDDATALTLTQVTSRCPLTKRQLLRNISVAFAPGSSIEIVGGGGSGKTVLAETLIGRFPRASGKVLLGTTDVQLLSIRDAAKVIGYVPQRVDFVCGTIEENIAGLAPVLDAERVVQVARMAGVHDRIRSIPDGYQTRIDAVGSIFSKSERHQIALARALYPDPQLLILDEPDTSFRDGLRNELKDTIGALLDRGGILVMLTRVPSKFYRASQSFTMDAGVLREVKADAAPSMKVVVAQAG